MTEMIDTGQMTDAELTAFMGTDAVAWAEEFLSRNPKISAVTWPPDDEMLGNLIAWFANAIEAGREAGRSASSTGEA